MPKQLPQEDWVEVEFSDECMSITPGAVFNGDHYDYMSKHFVPPDIAELDEEDIREWVENNTTEED